MLLAELKIRDLGARRALLSLSTEIRTGYEQLVVQNSPGKGGLQYDEQEAFARAQELQEKRSMEHAANHDLLMLSEDLELG